MQCTHNHSHTVAAQTKGKTLVNLWLYLEKIDSLTFEGKEGAGWTCTIVSDHFLIACAQDKDLWKITF